MTKFAPLLLKVKEETSFLDVFEEMEDETPYAEYEPRTFPYTIDPPMGVVCTFVREREGKYGPLMDADLVAIVNMETKEEVATEEMVTIPLSRANLRRGVQDLNLEKGDKIAIVNLGTEKIKSGKWKGRDCFDYRVKKLE